VARTDLPTAKPTQLPSGAWVLRVVIGKQRLRLPVAGPNATPREVQDAHRAILRDWDRIVAAFEEERARVAAEKSTADGPTFASVAKDWTRGALAKKYPDHVKKKRSAGDDAGRLRHVLDVLGSLPVSTIALDDLDRAMLGLPAHLSPATRRQVAQAAAKVLGFAVYPLKLRASNPVPRGWLPRVPKGDQRKQAMPYPDEHDRFLGSSAAAPVLRLFAGFTAREGMRHDEAESLTWGDLDLERGLVQLDENKTDDPRGWDLRPGVVRALVRWHEKRGKPKAGLVFTFDDGAPLRLRADAYRAELIRAGVDRAELHEGDGKTTKKTGLHALRALFVTEALMRGETETWVSDRTGHKSSQMISTYRRRARSWAGAGKVTPLADLDVALGWALNDGHERGHDDGKGSGNRAAEQRKAPMIPVSTEGGTRTHKPLRTADFEFPRGSATSGDPRGSESCPHCGEPLSELNMATPAATLEAWSEVLSFGVAGPCPGVLDG
jgi:integrase